MAAGPEILIPLMAVGFGIPFVGAPIARAYAKRLEARAAKPDAELMDRLASIERNVDVIAVEVEKLAEGQRFVTRLLAERAPSTAALPPAHPSSPPS
jgi:hypothetical protein